MKKYATGNLVDSEGNPVRDGSGQPIMTGSGRDEAETEARMESARNKLAAEVQDMVKEKKATPANDGDVDERDRRMEAAASAPSRAPTRPGQSSSGRKPSATVKAAPKAKVTPIGPAVMADEARKRRAAQASSSRDAAVMSGESRQRKAGREKAFMAAQTPAAAARERARLGDQSIKRAMPETALIGGGFGLKAMHSAAKNLAGTGVKTASKTMATGSKSPLRQKTEQLIREDKNPGRAVSTTTPKSSLSERTKELIRSDRTAKSNELSKQMAAKQAATKFTSKTKAASKRTKKFNEEEAGIEFKRGGKVGGSSASKRADGIAQRGKTRGKVY